ncbi:matrin-3-like isoform X4 [Polyodon spathula]|uniref:matrin-3-like isoform X4 n=1 Tax=Polyodon spathula TaxID=7913 RepID=UPI001B7E1732|nr:matrin-3-like isoform X4 [Polyodon spathula]
MSDNNGSFEGALMDGFGSSAFALSSYCNPTENGAGTASLNHGLNSGLSIQGTQNLDLVSAGVSHGIAPSLDVTRGPNSNSLQSGYLDKATNLFASLGLPRENLDALACMSEDHLSVENLQQSILQLKAQRAEGSSVSNRPRDFRSPPQEQPYRADREVKRRRTDAFAYSSGRMGGGTDLHYTAGYRTYYPSEYDWDGPTPRPERYFSDMQFWNWQHRSPYSKSHPSDFDRRPVRPGWDTCYPAPGYVAPPPLLPIDISRRRMCLDRRVGNVSFSGEMKSRRGERSHPLKEKQHRVIHLVNLPSENYTNEDLFDLAKSFGPVQCYKILRSNKEAFLEMKHPEAAEKMVRYYRTHAAKVNGDRIGVSMFLKHKKLAHWMREEVKSPSTSDEAPWSGSRSGRSVSGDRESSRTRRTSRYDQTRREESRDKSLERQERRTSRQREESSDKFMDSSESEGEEQENTALRLAKGKGPADKSMDSSDTEGDEQEKSGSKLGQGEEPDDKSLESLQTQEGELENKGSQSTQGEEPVDKPLESSEIPGEGQDKSCSQSAQGEESAAGPELREGGSSKVVDIRFRKWSCSVEDLLEMAEPFGTVVAYLVYQSSGFLEMLTYEQARVMVRYYQATTDPARELRICLSDKMTSVKRPLFEPVTSVLCFSNISRKTSRVDLQELAERFGAVLKITIANKIKKAFVEMVDRAEAEIMVTFYKKRPLRIHFKKIEVSLLKNYTFGCNGENATQEQTVPSESEKSVVPEREKIVVPESEKTRPPESEKTETVHNGEAGDSTNRPQAGNMKTTNTLGPYMPDNPVGLEYMVLRTGYFCRLCSVFSSSEKEKTAHCSSLEHYEKVKTSIAELDQQLRVESMQVSKM